VSGTGWLDTNRAQEMGSTLPTCCIKGGVDEGNIQQHQPVEKGIEAQLFRGPTT